MSSLMIGNHEPSSCVGICVCIERNVSDTRGLSFWRVVHGLVFMWSRVTRSLFFPNHNWDLSTTREHWREATGTNWKPVEVKACLEDNKSFRSIWSLQRSSFIESKLLRSPCQESPVAPQWQTSQEQTRAMLWTTIWGIWIYSSMASNARWRPMRFRVGYKSSWLINGSNSIHIFCNDERSQSFVTRTGISLQAAEWSNFQITHLNPSIWLCHG